MSWVQRAPHDSLDVTQSPLLELCLHGSSPGTLQTLPGCRETCHGMYGACGCLIYSLLVCRR